MYKKKAPLIKSWMLESFSYFDIPVIFCRTKKGYNPNNKSYSLKVIFILFCI